MRETLARHQLAANVNNCKSNLTNLVRNKPMKSYLKLFVLIGAVSLSVGLLSACSDQSTPPPQAPAPAPETVKPNS